MDFAAEASQLSRNGEPPQDTEQAKQRAEPSAAELHAHLVENSDNSTEELTAEKDQLQDEIEFLTDTATWYLIGHRHDVDIAEVFETKQREYSLDIANLQPAMHSVDLTAEVARVMDTNTFDRDDGSTGKVRNLLVDDETGKTQVTLWDEQVEWVDDLDAGATIRVENGDTKESDYCNDRYGCPVEVNVGDGTLLVKRGKDWQNLAEL